MSCDAQIWVSGYTTHRLYRSNKNTVDYNSTLCIPNAVNMTSATTGSNTKLISAGFQKNNYTQKHIIHQVQTKKKRGIKKLPLQFALSFHYCIVQQAPALLRLH